MTTEPTAGRLRRKGHQPPEGLAAEPDDAANGSGITERTSPEDHDQHEERAANRCAKPDGKRLPPERNADERGEPSNDQSDGSGAQRLRRDIHASPFSVLRYGCQPETLVPPGMATGGRNPRGAPEVAQADREDQGHPLVAVDGYRQLRRRCLSTAWSDPSSTIPLPSGNTMEQLCTLLRAS